MIDRWNGNQVQKYVCWISMVWVWFSHRTNYSLGWNFLIFFISSSRALVLSVFCITGFSPLWHLQQSQWFSCSTMVAWNGHSKCIDIVILSVLRAPRVLLHLFHFNSRNLFLYLQSKTLNVLIGRSLLRFRT